jgi:hypothetical protein
MTSSAPSATSAAGDPRVEVPVQRMLDLAKGIEVREGAAYWRNIASDDNHPAVQRRVAVLQLLKRHFKPGMTLAELAMTLGYPHWLKRNHIHPVLAGGFLVHATENEDGLFFIELFPDAAPGRAQIHFCTEGPINFIEFSDYITGAKVDTKVGRLVIRDMASLEVSASGKRTEDGYGLQQSDTY